MNDLPGWAYLLLSIPIGYLINLTTPFTKQYITRVSERRAAKLVRREKVQQLLTDVHARAPEFLFASVATHLFSIIYALSTAAIIFLFFEMMTLVSPAFESNVGLRFFVYFCALYCFAIVFGYAVDALGVIKRASQKRVQVLEMENADPKAQLADIEARVDLVETVMRGGPPPAAPPSS